MQFEVNRVLDVGAACGHASRVLRRRFRSSHVISIDLSFGMLQAARRARSRFSRISELQADAIALPIRSDSIDLVFANLLLPWINDLGGFLAGVARVLRKDGLFVFSTLGPDSLAELRDAWRAIDDAEHVNAFLDMHNVGDALMHAGLREPVVDVEHLAVTYGSVQSLFSDLTDAGARNCLQGRALGLTSRGRFDAMRNSLETRVDNGKLAVSLELVFGHAWGAGPPAPSGEFRFAPESIGRRQG